MKGKQKKQMPIYVYVYIYIYKTVCNLFRDSPYPGSSLHGMVTDHLNHNRSEITGMHKMSDTSTGNLITGFNNKS